MGAYCAEIRKLEKHFQGLEILHVLRDSNIAADVLAVTPLVLRSRLAPRFRPK